MKPPPQTVDKTNEFRQFDESFRQCACAFPFLKRRRSGVPPALQGEPEFVLRTKFCRLLALRRARNSLTAFLFANANSRSDLRRACEPLFICACGVKEKVENGICALSQTVYLWSTTREILTDFIFYVRFLAAFLPSGVPLYADENQIVTSASK